VVVQAANTEKVIRLVCSQLMDTTYASIIVSGHSESTIIDDCLALIPVNQNLTEEQKEEGQELFRSLHQLRQKRNRIVHSILAEDQSEGGDGDEAYLVALYDSRRKPGRAENITIADMTALPGELRDITCRILAWSTVLPNRQQILP
jgi:hypothetical protein